MNLREDIEKAIKANDLKKLMTDAAQIRGHFCPGLAMGIIASSYAMRQINVSSDGLEDLVAITETNNCFSDGVQFVTGCTFGNNALIFKDIGKTAFTLTQRDGNGIRLMALSVAREVIRKAYPEFSELYQKVVKEKNHDKEVLEKFKEAGVKRAFETLKIPAKELFKIESVKVKLPAYAPSHESVFCTKCGEEVMATRISDDQVCFTCLGSGYYQLDGHGIKKI